MPRWLSEGISVFEEKQENATWGQDMNPLFREMILGKDFTPLSELSAAFLAPKSDQHLQFAYYESSLAVEFLVQRFGIEAIKRILHDLGEGTEINESIGKHTASMDKLVPEFAEFARARAEKLAPGLDFEKPKRGAPAVTVTVEKVAEPSPAQATNFYALTREAKRLLREKKWQEAKVPAEQLRKLYPGHTGADNAFELLAEAHRRLGETNEERTILSDLASRDADSLDAYMRLMELNAARADWAGVATNAERYLAVNPLVPQPYGFLAEADETLGRRDEAIRASQTLARLDPADPAGVQFRLARLLHAGHEPAAKRHALMALEEAPRFRDAQKLLLKITRETSDAETNTPPPAPK